MKSFFTIIKEQISSFYMIIRLSIYQLKSINNNNYLGMLWEILNPLIQMSIYWFVFGLGIRGGDDVNGIPFVYWLSAGLVVWFFFSSACIQGSKAIYSRLNIITKMNFPMSAIPSYVVTSVFYQHITLLVTIIVIFLFSKQGMSIHLIQIPYYMVGLISLVFSISLITSTLSTIVRDVHQIFQSIIRMMLYLTPILWTPEKLPLFLQKVMTLNPLYYIVQGYRNALLGMGWFFDDIGYALYFWMVVFVLFLIGSILHVKFRRHFVDYL